MLGSPGKGPREPSLTASRGFAGGGSLPAGTAPYSSTGPGSAVLLRVRLSR